MAWHSLQADWGTIGVVLHTLLTLALVVRVLQQQRNNSVAIAWIAILFALPMVGIVAYLLFGEVNIGRRYRKRSMTAQQILADFARSQAIDFSQQTQGLTDSATQISRLGFRKTGLGVYDGHTATLLTESAAMFDHLLADIQAAKQLIILEFYIIYPKGRVDELLTALMAAAQRGVTCHILADSVGSFDFFASSWVTRLRAAGVTVHESLPVGLFKTLVKRIDIRNHRKIAVFDGSIGYTGSFNLADPKVFKQNANVGQWIDVLMRIETMPATADMPRVNVVQAMLLVASADISAETQDNLSSLEQSINQFTKRLYTATTPESLSPSSTLYVIARSREDMPLSRDVVATPAPDASNGALAATPSRFAPVENVALQLIPSAPELTGHVIYETLLSAIFSARESVTITTPYFVPDTPLLIALTTAAKRGIRVTLNLPKRVDSHLVHYASRAYYEPLLKTGVEIALFTGGLLHAKIVTIDADYCLFGTVNMDMRSFYLNMEVSVAIYSPPLIAQITACQGYYLTRSERLTLSAWRQRGYVSQLVDNGIRLLSPLL
ncbi:phospholipase D-like domain-containing protein [Faucicola atlantae]|uniref:phospholipase D-like domain-containing protein n=1 Tax=Faucicola atlantae TaxID=34059 RepID=UPI0025B163B0|nr:phospholipase D-like domain-containing protein [Moraxella atlantae]